jgi:alkylhydroperoxidase family enzyme
MLAELAVAVTEVPWTLSSDHHRRARAAGLSDDDLVHAIALSAYFGHLNRIADAVAVPLDYAVAHTPPHAEPATPPLLRAPAPVTGEPALPIAARPATSTAITTWRDYVTADYPASAAIASWVAALLGDGEPAPADGDPALRALVDLVVLAPWRLDDAAFAALRAQRYDDAAVFRTVAAASSFSAFSRIRVALIALGT